MAIIRYSKYLAGVLGLVAVASATPASTTTGGYPTPASVLCVTGTPAVRPSDGAFPIPYFASVTPAADGTDIVAHYTVGDAWYKAHYLGSKEIFGGAIDGYTAMKCQYTCNAKDGCVAFMVSNKDSCALFNAILEPADFIYNKDITPWGAYNKLCNPPVWPFTGGGKRDSVSYEPVRREEKVIGPSFTSHADNCTETHVAPMASWVNYAPKADFMSTHGRYTFTETDTGDGAGFETTHRACHKTCTGFGWCKSVFVSLPAVSGQWGCTLFDVNLTPDMYVEGAEGGKNTWPYGFNQQCPV